MSEEALCAENKIIVFQVQPVDQEFALFSKELNTQLKNSKYSNEFGWLTENAKEAMTAADYAIVAQTYWQIGNVADEKNIQSVDTTSLKFFANQAMAAQLGLNPKETISTENGKLKYLNPVFSEKIQLIQESAGLKASGILDAETLAAFTGLKISKLQENPVFYSPEIATPNCTSSSGCPFTWNQPVQ